MTLAQERLKQGKEYLRQALGDPQAEFRGGQWESIEQLLNKKRVLVVQRTGWGKSMVYFIATKFFREQGTGLTLMISPLLSLMRNQIEAANKLQITARSINSSNKHEKHQIEDELLRNKVDVLIISPERLANDDFDRNILSNMADNIGLFVVDEAHCISDWGNEFRPDYRRIKRVLEVMPPNVPVLATTATANDRVVEDIKSQLGENVVLQRGPLVRKSLRLQNIDMPNPAARMAWLAKTIPELPGSGIIYTLTKRDADRLAKWLQRKNINAKSYHGNSFDREKLEQQLLNNEVKALVATVALGMGFDKPDLGFVIHFQRPASVIHYYQQVGRAGRAVNEAYGVLLGGEEDDDIADYFIRNAFPPQKHISDIFKVLAPDKLIGLSTSEIQEALNLTSDQIDRALTYLIVESPSPVIKTRRNKWKLTSAADSYHIDQERIDKLTDIKRREQRNMRSYMSYPGCLMIYLQAALQGSEPDRCGQCINCNPEMSLDTTYDDDLVRQAESFLRGDYQRIFPKKVWLDQDEIPLEQRAEEGRALCLWRDAGWGQLVAQGKYDTNKFSDELVGACEKMVQKWSPTPAPEWVTCIPSRKHPELVPDFAEKLAKALGLPFIPCIEKVKDNQQQKEMENEHQQMKNLDGVFKITDECPGGRCLLIDDVIGSGWTFTVVAGLLRQKSCTAVYPLALALNSQWLD